MLNWVSMTSRMRTASTSDLKQQALVFHVGADHDEGAEHDEPHVWQEDAADDEADGDGLAEAGGGTGSL